MAWQKVQQSNMWDFSKEPVLEGTLRGRKTNVGENNSTVYTLERDGGETVQFWGSTVLDTQLEFLNLGARIKVSFLGMADSPKRKGKQYKNFIVEVWGE